MKISCLYFDQKYTCVSFTVHNKGPTLNDKLGIQITALIPNTNVKMICVKLQFQRCVILIFNPNPIDRDFKYVMFMSGR